MVGFSCLISLKALDHSEPDLRSMQAACPMNFDFSKVFGKGRIADENGIIDLRQPLTGYTITDGIKFDFSIGYDF